MAEHVVRLDVETNRVVPAAEFRVNIRYASNRSRHSLAGDPVSGHGEEADDVEL